MKTKLKSAKAITLIALIITIIVMLILVGVVVSVVINSNLLGTAKDAVDRTQAAYLNEGEFEYDFDEYLPEDNRKYKITYNLNEGINAEGQVTQYKKGDIVSLLNPTKEGAVFQGWYETNDFSGERVTKIVNRKGNITLYAKWLAETPGEYFTWTTTESAATITGFSTAGQTAYEQDKITTLVIPQKYNNLPVTTIGKSAFSGKNKIKELVIGNNVTDIGTYFTFENCTGIEELTIPISLNTASSTGFPPFEGCTEIKKFNFTKGNGLGVDYTSANAGGYKDTPWYKSRGHDIEVTFEEGINKIGNYMFYNCTGLKHDINLILNSLKNSLETIGKYAFYGCSGISGEITINKDYGQDSQYAFGKTGITKVSVIGETTKISNSMFSECNEIKEVIIGDNVTNIGTYAFEKCTGIEELTIPISLKTTSSAGFQPFAGCTEIKKINFTKGTGIGFDYTTDRTGGYEDTPWYISRGHDIEVTFENGIKRIGSSMFRGCTGLKCDIGEVMNTLRDSLETIGDNAFDSCTGITGELKWEKNYGTPKSGFNGCIGISKVTIGDNVTDIGTYYIFRNCTGIEELTIPISLNTASSTGFPPFEGCTEIKKFNFTKGNGIGVDYTSATVGGYKDTPWYKSRGHDIEVTFEKRITKIGNYMFNGCTGLKSVIYKDTTYTSLSALTSTFTGNSVTIGSNAFTSTGLGT